jgi:hypothetical protein
MVGDDERVEKLAALRAGRSSQAEPRRPATSPSGDERR